MLPGWKTHAARLAAVLADEGDLTDPRWVRAVGEVPRHVFVPVFYEPAADASGWESITAGNAPGRWASAVYQDRSLVTRLLSTPAVLDGRPVPSSSSTMPSLMGRMLELLDVADGHRVLEIGTGTGYNAALLSHRLGSDLVTSVELDGELTAAARTRLAEIGMRPTLLTGDGRAPAPDGAPYDRIIATCGVPRVPASWLSQLDGDGRILIDLRSEFSSSLVVLDKQVSGHVSGRLLGRPGLFMWMRPDVEHPLLDPHRQVTALQLTARGSARETTIDPALLDSAGLRTLIGIAAPELEAVVLPWRLIIDGSGSWARIAGTTVEQGGPRRLWDLIESLTRTWQQLGSPETAQFGLTVRNDGRHQFWLHEPSGPLPDDVQPATVQSIRS